MLWTLLAILAVLWLLGVATNVVGGFVHVLLVVALIVFIAEMLSGRRTA
ncbi:MAG TPA: lmo0937 family membrane protein [Candidatus Limnocylindrales bacterium]|jgi:hypothetical protein|nr:lmo0937 family membrane protein [Candidatus Limnocylindrales bacterium]